MKTIQDSISFMLTADENVINNTVKVTCKISALMDPDTSEAAFKASLLGMMSAFLPETKCQFGSMERSSHTSGREQVSLLASARIPESENYALDRRRDAVSRDGLRITSVATDTSPTQQQLEETNSKLRLSLIAKARAELTKINLEMGGDNYRLAKIIFDPESDMMPSKHAMSTSINYGSGFSGPRGPTGPTGMAGDSGDIGNAVKLTMNAAVVLRRTV